MSEQTTEQGAVTDDSFTDPSPVVEENGTPAPVASGEVAQAPQDSAGSEARIKRLEEINRQLQSRADSAEAQVKNQERGKLGDVERLQAELNDALAEIERLRAMYADLWWGTARKDICAQAGLPPDLWENVLLEPDEDAMRASAQRLKKRINAEGQPPTNNDPIPPPAAPGIPSGKQDPARDQRVEKMKKDGNTVGLIEERMFPS